MKSLIIYDSDYGNTTKVAQAIDEGFDGRAKLLPVGAVDVAKVRDSNHRVSYPGWPFTRIERLIGDAC